MRTLHLASTAEAAKTAMACEQLTAIADRGYYKGEQILACEERGIVPLVPKTYTSNSVAAGRFDKRDFRYDAHHDSYQCPAGETAPRRMTTQEGDSTIHTYWPSACPTCSVRDACTTASHRRIRRWEHEGVLDTMQRRLDHHPEAMRVRRQTVEHVLGTLKAWMGSTHFLTKTKPKVSTEMSLYVLAYNMKRVMQIVGVKALMQAIRA